jgi:hypothetical protein
MTHGCTQLRHGDRTLDEPTMADARGDGNVWRRNSRCDEIARGFDDAIRAMQQPAPSQQRADIDGQGNVIVQVLGNDNRVDFGRTYLKLTQHLKSRVDSEIDLLSPYSRSIPLVGRREEREQLRAWLARDKPISVRVLTGRAGAGKTRFALELCDELFIEGWAAGFVESGELRRFYDKQNLADWGWGRPTLIVIDYAAIHAKRLNDWLSELKGNTGLRDRPLRMLLLERHAEAGSGWWQTAFGRGSFGDRAIEKLLDPPEPIALPPLAETAERRAVIAETLEQADSEERPPEVGTDPSFDRELGELTWGGEPLFLMMAGLMAKQVGMARCCPSGGRISRSNLRTGNSHGSSGSAATTPAAPCSCISPPMQLYAVALRAAASRRRPLRKSRRCAGHRPEMTPGWPTSCVRRCPAPRAGSSRSCPTSSARLRSCAP